MENVLMEHIGTILNEHLTLSDLIIAYVASDNKINF